MLLSMWNLPWTRDPIHVPCIGKQILNHWTTRGIPQNICYRLFFSVQAHTLHRTAVLCIVRTRFSWSCLPESCSLDGFRLELIKWGKGMRFRGQKWSSKYDSLKIIVVWCGDCWKQVLKMSSSLFLLCSLLLLLFRLYIMSDALQPHGWQHTRLTCHSPSPGVRSNSCDATQPSHPLSSPSVLLRVLQCFPIVDPVDQQWPWALLQTLAGRPTEVAVFMSFPISVPCLLDVLGFPYSWLLSWSWLLCWPFTSPALSKTV